MDLDKEFQKLTGQLGRKKDPSQQGNRKPAVIPKIIGLALLLFIIGITLYYSLMINVGPNQVAIVMEYRGDEPPAENGFIATDPGQMGIQLQVWREGLHFVNPIYTETEIVDVVKIPENHVGYVLRKFGEDLPHGNIIAGEGDKGVLDVALKPGFYPEYSNKYAYEVSIQEAITVPRGSVGVVTNLAGPLPEEPNQFLSKKGARGVQEEYLTPGTYFVNPYTTQVDLVSIQSKRTDISDVEFPSYDGFPITLHCSVEWIIPETYAPITLVKFGSEKEVENKIIYPITLNLARLIGSSNEATTFISGETRQQFGRDFLKAMSASVASVSVEIKETGIRTILPPDEVLSILREREIAVQEKQQYLQEITRNAQELELQVQQTKALREKDIVDKKTEMLKQLLDRQRAQDVAILEAEKELEAAKVELQAARNVADASRTLARAKADATLLKFQAEAKAQKAAVDAFGTGSQAAMDYARFNLTKTLSTRIEEIFSGTDLLYQDTLLGKEGNQ